MSNLQVGFAGLTHLGLNYLAASSEKGFHVEGIDFDKDKIESLKNQNWKPFILAKDEVLIGGCVFLKNWIIYFCKS